MSLLKEIVLQKKISILGFIKSSFYIFIKLRKPIIITSLVLYIIIFLFIFSFTDNNLKSIILSKTIFFSAFFLIILILLFSHNFLLLLMKEIYEKGKITSFYKIFSNTRFNFFKITKLSLLLFLLIIFFILLVFGYYSIIITIDMENLYIFLVLPKLIIFITYGIFFNFLLNYSAFNPEEKLKFIFKNTFKIIKNGGLNKFLVHFVFVFIIIILLPLLVSIFLSGVSIFLSGVSQFLSNFGGYRIQFWTFRLILNYLIIVFILGGTMTYYLYLDKKYKKSGK